MNQPITDELLENLSRQLGVPCYQLRVPLNDEFTEWAEGVVKRPSIPALSAYLTLVDRDPLLAHEGLLRNCLVEGYYDHRLISDHDCFMSSVSPMQEFVRVRRGELKKKVSSGVLTQANTATSTEKQE